MLQIKFPSKKCATESWTIQIIKQFHAPSPTPFETGSFENSIDKTTTQNSKKDEALRLSKPAKSNFIQPKDFKHNSLLNTKRQHSFHLTPGAGTKEDNTSLVPISRQFTNVPIQSRLFTNVPIQSRRSGTCNLCYKLQTKAENHIPRSQKVSPNE